MLSPLATTLPGRVVRRIVRDTRRAYRLRTQTRPAGIEYHPQNFIFRPVSPGDVVIDCGCSYAAEMALMMIDRFGAVAYCVDPTRKHAPALRKLEAAYPGRFHYLPAAICASNGTLTFHESVQNESGSLLTDHTNVVSDSVRSYDVEGLTPAALFARLGVTEVAFLKLDIEGAEYELLGNMDLADLRVCKQVFVEFHHHAVKAFSQKDTKMIAERFRNAGFVPYSVDDHNYLFVRQQSAGTGN
jgi:FkbM family methyltransferase